MTFKNTHLSVSRLEKYERCNAAFFFGYVDKGPVEPRGIPAVFGVCLHEALEALFRWVIDTEYVGLFPLAELIGFYQRVWQESDMTSVGASVALYQEGLTLLRAYANRYPTVDHLGILAVEQEFNLQVEEFVINGYIDRVEKLGDDGVLIVDYKSGRALYTRSELETSLQAATYLLAAKTLYPWAKRIEFAFDMLRHDTRQAAPRSMQEIEDARGYLVALGRRTERDTEWKPRLNELCGWCDHRRRCSAYQKALQGGEPLAKINTLQGVEEIAAERERVAKLAKMMYGRKESLDTLLKAKITQDGEFTAAGTHYRLVPAWDTTYLDTERVIRAFVEYGGLSPQVARMRLLTLEASTVKNLALEVSKTVDRVQAATLQATLAAMAIKTPGTSRMDARAEKKSPTAQRADDRAKEAALAPGNARIAALTLDDSVFE